MMRMRFVRRSIAFLETNTMALMAAGTLSAHEPAPG
jgi:hypothetical protein